MATKRRHYIYFGELGAVWKRDEVIAWSRQIAGWIRGFFLKITIIIWSAAGGAVQPCSTGVCWLFAIGIAALVRWGCRWCCHPIPSIPHTLHTAARICSYPGSSTTCERCWQDPASCSAARSPYQQHKCSFPTSAAHLTADFTGDSSRADPLALNLPSPEAHTGWVLGHCCKHRTSLLLAYPVGPFISHHAG